MKKLFLALIGLGLMVNFALSDQYDQYYSNASENWKNQQREYDRMLQQQKMDEQQQQINKLQRSQRGGSTPLTEIFLYLLGRHDQKVQQKQQQLQQQQWNEQRERNFQREQEHQWQLQEQDRQRRE